MGFFDKLLKAIGFEDENEETIEKPVKENKKKEKAPELTAKFDLRNQIKEEKASFKPNTQEEVEKIIEEYLTGKEIEVDLSAFILEDRMRALDFVSGAVFVLKGKIEKLEDGKYLLKRK